MMSSFKTNDNFAKLHNLEARSDADPLDTKLDEKINLTKHKSTNLNSFKASSSPLKMNKLNSTDLERIESASSFQGT